MKDAITLSQLLSVTLPISAGLVISLLMFWKNTDVRLKALEIRVDANEKNEERIMSKLDDLQKSVNDIKIALQDKQDRK
jgi:hypothetical protein